MKRISRFAAVVTAAALLWTPAVADEKKSDQVGITGTVSATPAAGAAEVAVSVKTAPSADKKSIAAGIKGTVIIVTLAPGVAVKRNGDTVAISELRADDKVTITLSARTGTAAPYKYVASKFIATSAGLNYGMALSGVIAVAPPESATSVMVFVKSYSANRFTPVVNIKNTTIQVVLAAGGTVTRNGVASSLAGLKIDDRVTVTITERTGTTAPYTYVANRIVATAANTALPVTVTGSVVTTPAAGATSVSVHVKHVTKDVGWANDDLEGTTILVALAPGGTLTRNGEAITIPAMRLDDRITMTLTSRTGASAPYLYLASTMVATAFTSMPFSITGSVVSLPESGTARVIVYLKSIVENDDHNAYANALKGRAILVTLASGGTVTRNGAASTLGALQFNDTVNITIADRTGIAEPYTYAASRVTATG